MHLKQQRFCVCLSDTVDVRFAKLLLANCDQVKEILAAEKRELQQQLSEEGDSLEGSFVQAALQLLKVRAVLFRLIPQLK